MSAITHSSSTGITAQAASASTQVTSGAKRKTPLLAPAGMTGSLNDEFEQIGERLQQSPGPDHVRAAPDLHRRPDLAVGIDDVGDRDQKNDQQQHALGQHHQHGPEAHDRPDWVKNSENMRLFRRRPRGASFRDHRALGHHGRGARDRIGQVEVIDRRHERRLVRLAAEVRELGDVGRDRPARSGRCAADAGAP